MQTINGALVARYTMGLGVDEPLAMLRGGTTYYYLVDGLGSTSRLFNAATEAYPAYFYTAFGGLAPIGVIHQAVNSLEFTGREWDAETGLYYYRARYYDPAVGRFLSEDPIGFAGGVNFYTYVGNSPTNLIDPKGLEAMTINTIFGPITITWGRSSMTPEEIVAEDIHEQDHRDRLSRGEKLPPWQKEQLGWAAELPYLEHQLRVLKNMCPTESTRDDLKRRIDVLSDELHRAQSLSTEWGAKNYWNENVRKPWQNKVPLPK